MQSALGGNEGKLSEGMIGMWPCALGLKVELKPPNLKPCLASKLPSPNFERFASAILLLGRGLKVFWLVMNDTRVFFQQLQV